MSPWLFAVPSQVLRNSASNWYDTYRKFMRGICGKPRYKKKTDFGSVHLTRELFHFKKCADGVTRLLIGTEKNNVGYLKIKNHKKYQKPNSLYIKKKAGKYWVAFCCGEPDKLNSETLQKNHLEHLSTCDTSYLEQHVVGIDRGVAIPVQCHETAYNFTSEQKRHKAINEKKLKRYQRRMARQQKNSNRRKTTKHKIARCHQKISNIRHDFCHKTSHHIVSNSENKVIVLEDLKTKNLTQKPKARSKSR